MFTNLSKTLPPLILATIASSGPCGMAFRVTGSGHAYTNGNGTNQYYSDPALSLSFGASQNVPWGASFQPRVWNGRILHEAVCAGALSFTGSGCVDSGGTSNYLAHAGCPDLGSALQISLHGSASSSGNAFLALGLSDTTWAGLALPYDLGLHGAGGCTLLVSPDFPSGSLPLSSGVASWNLAIPRDSTLAGLPVLVQGYHVDPGANVLGLVLTNYIRAVLG